MVITARMYLIVLPLVFIASLIDAISGGGGLISLPAYMVTGMPSVLASGSNKLSASVGTVVAAARYLKSGRVLLLPALCAAALAIPGAYLGAGLLNAMPESIYRTIVLVLVPLMALLTVLNRGAPDRARTMNGARLGLCALTGLLCGLYDGFFGPGTGVLLILGFHWIAGMDTVTASGSAKLCNLASNITALAVHLRNGNVLLALAVPAMLASALGGYIGSALAIRRGAGLIRLAMLLVMAGLVVKLAFEYL